MKFRLWFFTVLLSASSGRLAWALEGQLFLLDSKDSEPKFLFSSVDSKVNSKLDSKLDLKLNTKTEIDSPDEKLREIIFKKPSGEIVAQEKIIFRCA